MATSTTRGTFRSQLFKEVKELGWEITVTTVNASATATTSDADVVALITEASTALNGYTLHIPSALSAMQVRRVNTGTVASGVATLTMYGGNYSPANTSVTAFLMRPGFRPDWLDDVLNDTLEFEFAEFTTLLSLPIADQDMASSATTDWTGSAGTTLSKVTAAGNVPYLATRALRVQSDTANDYAESAAVLVTTSTPYRAGGFARSAVGTAILRAQGAASIDSESHTQSAFQFLWFDFDSGTDESVTLRLEGSESTADIYWGPVSILPRDRATIPLPSWVNDRHKLKAVSRGYFSRNTASGIEDARTLRLVRLVERRGAGGDYRYITSQWAANPHQIELMDAVSAPLFITGERPHADLESFTDDATGTTSMPPHIYMSRAKWLLGERAGELQRVYAVQKARNEVVQRERLRETDAPPEPEVLNMFGW